MLKHVLGSLLSSAALCQALTYPELLQTRQDLTNWTSIVYNDPFVFNLFNSAQNITCFAAQDSVYQRYVADPVLGSFFTAPEQIRVPLIYTCFHGTYYSSAFTSDPTFLRSLLNSNTTVPNITAGSYPASGAVIEVVKYDNGTVSALSYPTTIQSAARVHPGPRFESWIVEPDISFDGGVLHLVDELFNPGNTVTLPVVGQVYDSQPLIVLNSTGFIKPASFYQEATYIICSNSAYQTYKTLPNEQRQILDPYLKIFGQAIYTDSFTEEGTNITSQGYPLTLSKKNGDYYINNCRVTIPNALVVNGVVHFTDCYPVPPGSGIPQAY